jgi:hypothetical protein
MADVKPMMHPMYPAYIRFGYDFDHKHTKEGLLDIIDEFDIPTQSGNKPSLLYQVERFFAEAREADDKHPTEHLRPQFRPINWRIPHLRQMLAFHNIPYPPRPTKLELTDIFEDRRDEILFQHNIVSSYVQDPAVESDLSQGMGATSLGSGSDAGSSGNHGPSTYARPHFQQRYPGNQSRGRGATPTSNPSSSASASSNGKQHRFGNPSAMRGTAPSVNAGNAFPGNAGTPPTSNAFTQANSSAQRNNQQSQAQSHAQAQAHAAQQIQQAQAALQALQAEQDELLRAQHAQAQAEATQQAQEAEQAELLRAQHAQAQPQSSEIDYKLQHDMEQVLLGRYGTDKDAIKASLMTMLNQL